MRLENKKRRQIRPWRRGKRIKVARSWQGRLRTTFQVIEITFIPPRFFNGVTRTKTLGAWLACVELTSLFSIPCSGQASWIQHFSPTFFITNCHKMSCNCCSFRGWLNVWAYLYPFNPTWSWHEFVGTWPFILNNNDFINYIYIIFAELMPCYVAVWCILIHLHSHKLINYYSRSTMLYMYRY